MTKTQILLLLLVIVIFIIIVTKTNIGADISIDHNNEIEVGDLFKRILPNS